MDTALRAEERGGERSHGPIALYPRPLPVRAIVVVAKFLLFEICLCLCLVAAELLPVVVVPASVGAVIWLLRLAGVAAGVAAAFWLYAVAKAVLCWPARWLPAGAAARPPLFRRPWSRAGSRALVTLVMCAAVPALIIWGPVIGGITLAGGFENQHLASVLRQYGVPARGYVDVITRKLGLVTTDNGITQEAYSDSVDLQFMTREGIEVLVPVPGLRGWDGDISSGLVPIVYDPAQPTTAALAVQLRGSQWAAPVPGTLISAVLLTGGLPVLVWALIRRVRSGRAGESADLFFD